VRRTGLPVLLVTTALCAGCASALHDPPPLGALGAATGPARTEQITGADVDRTLAEAEAAFARRPDAAAVRGARERFLAAARAEESRVEGLLGAARATAWLIEHDADATRRTALAVEAVQACQWCQRRQPSSIECDYRLALALGQQARERPSTASDALALMVSLLGKVRASAPRLDHAGGDRVLALVLLRAPGWPAGPGDPDAGLEHAGKAVELEPAYPPNLLVLAEALAAVGRRDEASATYARAAEMARAASAEPDAPEWVAEAARARGVK
jgi:hypothetical protein